LKIVTVWNDRSDNNIHAAGSDIEKVNDFCYLGSYISHNDSSEKDVRVHIGKATALFGQMKKMEEQVYQPESEDEAV